MNKQYRVKTSESFLSSPNHHLSYPVNKGTRNYHNCMQVKTELCSVKKKQIHKMLTIAGMEISVALGCTSLPSGPMLIFDWLTVQSAGDTTL